MLYYITRGSGLFFPKFVWQFDLDGWVYSFRFRCGVAYPQLPVRLPFVSFRLVEKQSDSAAISGCQPHHAPHHAPQCIFCRETCREKQQKIHGRRLEVLESSRQSFMPAICPESRLRERIHASLDKVGPRHFQIS